MKTNNNLDTKIKYKLYRILPNIYFLECGDQFDLNMLFARYQEYYESDNPNVKGKNVDIIKWMRWYSQNKSTQKNLFTYTDDWAGFNVPSESLKNCLQSLSEFDKNIYDWEMDKIVGYIQNDNVNLRFYLIGATSSEKWVFKHELAHAFYYLNNYNIHPKFKKRISYQEWSKMNLKLIPQNLKKKMYSCIKEYGYDKSVYDDEFQAYMSTGLVDIMKKKAPQLSKYRSEFIKMFNVYFKENKIQKKLIYQSK